MPRRSRPPERLGALVALAGFLASSVTARADDVTGALDAHARISIDGRHGAGVSADALWGGPRWRAGLHLGLDAVAGGGGETSAVLTPLGLAGQFSARGGATPFAGLRGGFLPGLEQRGLMLGGFAAFHAGYAFALGDAATLRLSAEAWVGGAAGRREVWLSPCLGIGF
jgi:hypothetical protein